MVLRLFSFLLLFLSYAAYSQVSVCSWNIENLGRSKSDSAIEFMASVVRKYDIIAIQEVVAKDPAGAQAVARLAEALNRTGHKWDYSISDATSSSAYKAERYAFIWKVAKVKPMGRPWLEKNYNLEIDREPYYATFTYNEKQFTLVNFHAITKSRQPEREIKFFKFLPGQYTSLNLIFAGDFNCPEFHTVFIPLKKMGYRSVFQGQKTTLRQKMGDNNSCLASEFDNFFYNGERVTVIQSGAIHFYEHFASLKEAGEISDHIPIWFSFIL